MADENLDVLDELDDELAPTVDLEVEDGTVVECECIDTIEYEGEQYVVLLPVEDEDADEDDAVELMILKVEATDEVDEDGEEYEQYVDVASEELLATLFDLFKQKNAGKYDFIEE